MTHVGNGNRWGNRWHRPRLVRPRGVARLLACCALVLLGRGAAEAAVWSNYGPLGGNGTALAVDPTSPSTMYAGTNGGGLFKSTDGGATWQAVNDGVDQPGSIVVEALAVDPSEPDRVYAAVSSGTSGGVFRTTDGGASWTLQPLGAVTDVAIDPAQPTTLYASGDAVYKSTDAGASWTPVHAGTFRSIAIDPLAPQTVYAGTLFGTIEKTTDGGANWTTLFGLASDEVKAIVVHPADSNVVFAGLEDFGVYRSVDGGMIWTSIGPTVGAQAVSIEDLVIDPSEPSTMYAGGFLAGPAPSVGVYRTTDGGATWDATTLVALVRALALDPAAPSTVFAATQDGVAVWKSSDSGEAWSVANDGIVNTNVGAVATAPSDPGTVYAATLFDTVFRSGDGGVTWAKTPFPAALNQIFSIAVDPTTSAVAYVGTQFDGVFKTEDGGATWTDVGTGSLPALIGSLVVDPSDPDVVYAGGFGGVARSTIGGGDWTLVNNGLVPPIVTALAIDPTTPSTLYAGTDPVQGAFSGVFKTTNGGGLWTPVNTGLPAQTGLGVKALALDPLAPANLYVAFGTVGVYRTTDGGTSWTPASVGLAGQDVQSLAVDPVVAGTVYAGTRGGGVFVSTNGGASWGAANVGLYNPFVRALAIEPGRLYAGTGASGVFVTELSTSPADAFLGKSFVVRDPNTDDASRRVITALASGPSAATLDVDALVSGGATLTVSARGETFQSQTFLLPPPWKRVGANGARYTDPKGVHGPVTNVTVSKSASGVLKLSVRIVGKKGPGPQPHITVVPPNPGTEGQVRLEVEGGATYCASFGGAAGGVVFNKGPNLFRVTRPTAAVCP